MKFFFSRRTEKRQTSVFNNSNNVDLNGSLHSSIFGTTQRSKVVKKTLDFHNTPILKNNFIKKVDL